MNTYPRSGHLADRLAQEAAFLAARYRQSVEYGWDPELARWWVHLGRLPLPKGWRNRSTAILVTVTDGYPTAPPDGFLLDSGLRDRSGRAPGHYFDRHGSPGSVGMLGGAGWSWFCIHPRGWRGDYDFRDGDSIAKYLDLIEIALAQVVR